jgi:hypothetical protein
VPDTVPAAEVTDLIAAILGALDAPDPAGAYRLREELVNQRAAYIVGVLKSAAAGDLGDLATTTRIIREVGNFAPVRYETAAEGGA